MSDKMAKLKISNKVWDYGRKGLKVINYEINRTEKDDRAILAKLWKVM
jgi:hypothetical protein